MSSYHVLIFRCAIGNDGYRNGGGGGGSYGGNYSHASSGGPDWWED